MAEPKQEPEYSEAFLAESTQPYIIFLFSLALAVNVISTGLRLGIKLTKPGSNRLMSDDYFMVFATLMSIGLNLVCLAGWIPSGLGRHIASLTIDEAFVNGYNRSVFGFGHFMILSFGTTKISVLLLYHRVFSIAGFRKLLLGIIVVVALWMISLEIAFSFACFPLDKYWAVVDPQLWTCFNRGAFNISITTSNIVLDFVIFALPIPIILKLQTPSRKRRSLLFLFSFGSAVCLIGVARTGFNIAEMHSNTRHIWKNDITWWNVPSTVLCAWEVSGAILCANLPMIYSTLKKSAQKAKDSLSGSRRRTNGAYDSGAVVSGGHSQSGRNWNRLHPFEDDKSGMVNTVVSSDQTMELSPMGKSGIVVTRNFEASDEEALTPGRASLETEPTYRATHGPGPTRFY